MPHAKPHSEQLAELYRQLRQALDVSDWSALGRLSLEIRQLLSVLPADAQLEPLARGMKQRLGELHAQALEACRSECERLRDVLADHAEHAEGRSAYSQIDSFIGEDA